MIRSKLYEFPQNERFKERETKREKREMSFFFLDFTKREEIKD